jgi:hypothetical protein
VKLNKRVLDRLAEMVIGDNPLFRYRSSSAIDRFFNRCGHSFIHDGSTRKWWVSDRPAELNLGPCTAADLPSDGIVNVINEMFEPFDFEEAEKTLQPAIEALNKLLSREGLVAYLDASGRCFLRNTGTRVNSSTFQARRPLSQEELQQRQKVADFLDSASEDEFTERLLVPFFQRLGFQRVSQSGHNEKMLEFGKDLWMKYQLPTGHWLYFCAQIKRDKIDASGTGGVNNAANVLTQAKMAIGHPIFDPDANRKVLLDHIFVIAGGEITRAAQTWIIERLDAEQRRHIIFMGRDEFLDHSARILLDLGLEATGEIWSDDIPF